jgi:hypothetical protein
LPSVLTPETAEADRVSRRPIAPGVLDRSVRLEAGLLVASVAKRFVFRSAATA